MMMKMLLFCINLIRYVYICSINQTHLNLINQTDHKNVKENFFNKKSLNILVTIALAQQVEFFL